MERICVLIKSLLCSFPEKCVGCSAGGAGEHSERSAEGHRVRAGSHSDPAGTHRSPGPSVRPAAAAAHYNRLFIMSTHQNTPLQFPHESL